jgi:RHS repeat-associated protein
VSEYTIFYVYDGINPVVEYAPNGSILARYVYAGGMHIAKIAGADTHWYHCDALGSPRKMTDESGSVVWSATYYPFGEMTAGSSNTHGFTGKEYDSEMGLNYFCQRYYDPQIGRFMTRDLIQQPVYSTYAYCVNNPLKYVDPLGLDEEPPALHIYYDRETGGMWSYYWSAIYGELTITVVAPIADEQIGNGESPGAGEVESEDVPSFSQMIAIRSLTHGSEGNPGADINDEPGSDRDFNDWLDYRNCLPYFPPAGEVIKAIDKLKHSFLAMLQTEANIALGPWGTGVGDLRLTSNHTNYHYTLKDVQGFGGGVQVGIMWSQTPPSTPTEVDFTTVQLLILAFTFHGDPSNWYSDPNLGYSVSYSVGSPFGVSWGKTKLDTLNR